MVRALCPGSRGLERRGRARTGPGDPTGVVRSWRWRDLAVASPDAAFDLVGEEEDGERVVADGQIGHGREGVAAPRVLLAEHERGVGAVARPVSAGGESPREHVR